jgi:hypothetical protein
MRGRFAAMLTVLLGIGIGVVTASGAFDGVFASTAQAPPPDAPVTVVWTGNGTTNGQCDDNSATAGQQQDWLFILTSPTGSSWTLTATFQNSGTQVVDGTQQGDGSIHFDVITSLNDTLLSASATNGTANSVLTVSHCTGVTSGTTTTTTTTTTTPKKPPPPPPTTTSPTTAPSSPTTAPTTATTKPPTTFFVPAPQITAIPPSASFTG